jgi:hypothetical protein
MQMCKFISSFDLVRVQSPTKMAVLVAGLCSVFEGGQRDDRDD